MRFIKFLLGVLVGAAAASLVTPKTGRQMREQLLSGAGGGLMPATPEYPEPSGEREWDVPATTVAEPPVVEVVEEAAPVEEVTEEALVEEAPAEEVAAEGEGPEAVEELQATVGPEALAEAVAQPVEEPVEEVVEEPVEAVGEEAAEEKATDEGEDLRDRIEETRAAVESEIEQPFAPAEEEAEAVVEDETAAVPEGEEAEEPAPVAEVETAEPVAEEAVAETVEGVPSGEVESDRIPAVVEEAEAGSPEEQEGAPIDQAEMRRRIEETRARLKAKAFDAMTSGESALLSRDSGEKPVPRSSGVDIDEEAASSLDESLAPEED